MTSSPFGGPTVQMEPPSPHRIPRPGSPPPDDWTALRVTASTGMLPIVVGLPVWLIRMAGPLVRRAMGRG